VYCFCGPGDNEGSCYLLKIPEITMFDSLAAHKEAAADNGASGGNGRSNTGESVANKENGDNLMQIDEDTLPELNQDINLPMIGRLARDRAYSVPMVSTTVPERNRSYSVSVADESSSELIVGRSVKTRVLRKINEGAFGEIHVGELLEDGKQVAVKLELQTIAHPQLLSEGNIYRHLQGGPGIPQVYWFGLHEPLYNVMVMDLLGPSLQDLFVYCNHKFTVKTTLMLVDQMLSILEFFHKKQYLHRDVKPDNFMMGLGDKANQVYVIDLGLTKKITRQRFSVGQISSTLVHPMVGTVRYAGIHAHLGHEEGARDDLESLAYVWAFFLRGSLPWQGVEARNRDEKFARIRDMKKLTKAAELFEGFPHEFERYLDYVRAMRKDELPNYQRVRDVFRKLAAHSGIAYDFEFDWIVKERETGEPVKACGPKNHSGDSR